ncbi:MAG TPA: acetoacetate decarboxylase family protein [Polyangiaceae bacterium]|nr:acetoacetate decarboxylase family protein [Polyangiaceae bacterium]
MRRTIAVLSVLALASPLGCASTNDLASQKQAIEGGQCPADWYDVTPPNPDWNLPPTLGDLLPLRFYDTESIAVFFPADFAALQTMLPPGVSPLEVAPGLGVVTIGFSIYGDSDYLGKFREATISVLVSDSSLYEGYTPLYFLDILATSEAAQWKNAAAFNFNNLALGDDNGNAHCQEYSPKRIRCIASAYDQLIFKIDVDTSDMVPVPIPPVLMMSEKDGMLLRTPWIASGKAFGSDTVGGTTIQLGDHPVAQLLKAIGVGTLPSINQAVAPSEDATLYPSTCAPL